MRGDFINRWQGLIPQTMWDRKKDYAVFTAEWNTIAASAAQQPVDVAISQDADFLGMYLTRVVTNAAGTTFSTNAPLLVMIIDQTNGINITDRYTFLDNVAGVAQNPAVLPIPKLIPRSSKVTFNLTNLDGANAYRVQISLHGVRVFNQAA